MCSAVVNGVPHGGQKRTTLCQLHMRTFKDGDVIYLEPWRARAFPIIKDLVVDRGALDKLIQAAGHVGVHTGGVPDGNAILIGKREADYAMDAAECIGCGACVAACPNGAGMLFAGAKVSQLAELPQGQVEAPDRVAKFIARLNREFLKALAKDKVGALPKSAAGAAG
jgi:succinate dehydrogenase / fumarate reductase iron-sulfur subunit